MKKVFKYEVELDDYVTIDLPMDSKILKFADQNGSIRTGKIYVWALVDTNFLDAGMEERRKFRIAGTGHPLDLDEIGDERYRYFDTILTLSDALVWHIFEVVQEIKRVNME